MPQTETIFAKLAGNRFFSKFDFSKGYWAIRMSEKDMDITTFTSYRGLYKFTVMLFGLVNAPVTFNRLMRKLLEGNDNLNS